jgi:hypothetical protein
MTTIWLDLFVEFLIFMGCGLLMLTYLGFLFNFFSRPLSLSHTFADFHSLTLTMETWNLASPWNKQTKQGLTLFRSLDIYSQILNRESSHSCYKSSPTGTRYYEIRTRQKTKQKSKSIRFHSKERDCGDFLLFRRVNDGESSPMSHTRKIPAKVIIHRSFIH